MNIYKVSFLLKVVALAFIRYRELKFNFTVRKDLSQSLFEGYLSQPYEFHIKRNSSELLRNTITEVEKFGAVTLSFNMLLGEVLVFIGILIYFHSNNFDILHHFFLITSLSLSGLVSYARSKAESLNIKCSVGIMTRGERIVVLVLGIIIETFFIDAILYSLIIISILSIITFIQRISLINSMLKTANKYN